MHISLTPLDLSAAARRPEASNGAVQGKDARPEALAQPAERPIEAAPRGDPPDAHGQDLSRDGRRRAHAVEGQEDDDAEDPRLREMSQRDREVRQHELAHMAAAGRYGGAATFHYERGPDGKRYAVSGEVPIDLTPVKGDPKATLRKMQQIRRAALSPADPSPRDRQVAAQAAALELQARAAIAAQQRVVFGIPGSSTVEEEATPGAPPDEAASVVAKRKAGAEIDKMLKRSMGAKAYLRSLGSGPRASGRAGTHMHVVRGRPRAAR